MFVLIMGNMIPLTLIIVFSLSSILQNMNATPLPVDFCMDARTGEVFPCKPLKKEGPPVRSCRGYEDNLLKLKEDLAFTSEMFPDAKRNRIKLKIEEEFVGFKKLCPKEYESFCQYEKSLCQE